MDDDDNLYDLEDSGIIEDYAIDEEFIVNSDNEEESDKTNNQNILY